MPTSVFFHCTFAAGYPGGGKVIALEPEPKNYALLSHTVKSYQEKKIIETLAVAVDSSDGNAKLFFNPLHPGDHKLGSEGLEVTTISIDTLLEKRNWPSVSLVKIDVQGAEMRVLAGARRTISHLRPAFFVEMDESALAQFGTSTQEIFCFFHEFAYSAHSMQKNGISEPLAMLDIRHILEKRNYTDIVFCRFPVARATVQRLI
ncbi:FkbM family methyltransferase [Thermodesulfobacteriota bacterium]